MKFLLVILLLHLLSLAFSLYCLAMTYFHVLPLCFYNVKGALRWLNIIQQLTMPYVENITVMTQFKSNPEKCCSLGKRQATTLRDEIKSQFPSTSTLH